jgi:hypothetical protein
MNMNCDPSVAAAKIRSNAYDGDLAVEGAAEPL